MKRSISIILFVGLLTLVLAACGGNVTTESDVTPRAGWWHDEDFRIDFEVTEGGGIENFTWDVGSRVDRNLCPISADRIPWENGVGRMILDSDTGSTIFELTIIFTSETTAAIKTSYNACLWAGQFFLEEQVYEVNVTWRQGEAPERGMPNTPLPTLTPTEESVPSVEATEIPTEETIASPTPPGGGAEAMTATAIAIPDSDGDGVLDDKDAYPNDASRH